MSGEDRPVRPMSSVPARWARSVAALFATPLVLCLAAIAQTRAHEAPFFMDYRDAAALNGVQCDSQTTPDGCWALQNVGLEVKSATGALLPIVNPPDGHIFYARIGGEISFFASGQQGNGEEAKTLSILFEEDPSFMTEKAFQYTKPNAALEKAFIDQASFKIFDNDNSVYSAYNPIARKFSVLVDRFVPSNQLTMCFRLVMSCPFPYAACAGLGPGAPENAVNCCFKNPAEDTPKDFSIVMDGMGKGAGGNSDAPTSHERPCFPDEDGRCFDSRFYPRRCVRMYVAEPPQVVSVLPQDRLQLDGEIKLTPPDCCHGSPAPPDPSASAYTRDQCEITPCWEWLQNSTTADVHVKAGQILRLNVDAVDVNEEDDVDVKVAHGVELPSGAALGPRMCCDSEFNHCEVTELGSVTRTRVCEWKCGSAMPTEHTQTMLNSSCVQVCQETVERKPCRHVRRQLRMQPTPALVADHPEKWTGISFVAFDDSGRLNSPVDGVCCQAANLESDPSPAVSIMASSPRAAFVDPFPRDIVRLPDAYVNCPMPALTVHAFSAHDQNVYILPEGCHVGTDSNGQPVLPPTLSEGCPTKEYCDICYPKFPKGVQVHGQAKSMWAETNFSWTNHSYRTLDLHPYYVGGADYVVEMMGASSTLSISAFANVVPPPKSHIVIRGVHSSSAPGEVACKLATGGVEEEWAVDTMMTGLELRLHVVWPEDASMLDMDPSMKTHVTCTFAGAQVSMAPDASLAFESPESILTAGQYPHVMTTPAPFTATSNATSRFFGGGGAAGLALSRLVQWTPAKGQEGQDYHLCFSAVGFTNTTQPAMAQAIAHADRRCFAVRVVRCMYCTVEGDTLETLAKFLGTSWMQLWGANSALGIMPSDLKAGTLITLGAVHLLPKDMMLQDLALQFATTEAAIRGLNPDLPSDEHWAGMGRSVCIAPGVCDSSVAPDGSGSMPLAFALREDAAHDAAGDPAA